jgi:hypothetical protein
LFVRFVAALLRSLASAQLTLDTLARNTDRDVLECREGDLDIVVVIAKVLLAFGALLLALRVLANVSLPMRRVSRVMMRNLLFTLYEHGRNNAFLKIRVRGRGSEIRVHKNIVSMDDVHLVVHLPAEFDHPALFNTLQHMSSQATTNGGRGIVVDCGSSYDDALRVVVSAVTTAINAEFEGSCDTRMVGMHPDLGQRPGFSA